VSARWPPVDEHLASEAPRGKSVLWGVVVTYRRPAALAETLAALARQTRLVDRLLVIDNAGDSETARLASDAGATYVDAGTNLGPAGAIDLGMRLVLREARAEDWLLLLDDDDPPTSEGAVRQLHEFGERMAALDAGTAGVGLTGARYNPCRGVVERVPDAELSGPVPVDHIGGGQLPMYRCGPVSRVGTFDPGLFFGFEELEYGLRLHRAGYHLYIDGAAWRERRQEAGRLGLHPSALRTSSDTAAWRRFYSARNIVLIARRYGTRRLTAPRVATLGALRGMLALAAARRPPSEVLLPAKGAVAGLLQHSGRTVDPGEAKKTA
jgi:glycosyltransferase involved in cell wall biosynthesis